MVYPVLSFINFGVVVIILTGCRCRGFHVELRAPRYVSFGNSAMLKCDYSVPEEDLHKVEWLHNTQKIWQYVKGRNPPYRNFTTPGSIIDLSLSDRHQVLLTDLNFDASGIYTCEVSTERPMIFTKASEELELTVIRNQMENPRITFKKPEYTVGDWLKVNCTSGSARPTPDVTWLLNGKKVNETLIRSFTEQNPASVTAQLTLQLTEEHVDRLELTCLATIPKYQDNYIHQSEYADHKSESVEEQNPASVTAQLTLQLTEEHVDRLELTCLATIPKYQDNYIHQSEYADHKSESVEVDVVLIQQKASTGAQNMSEVKSLASAPPLLLISLLIPVLILVLCRS